MARKRIVIVGAGGMARETEALIRACNARREDFEFIGYVVTDIRKVGKNDTRDRILGDYEWLVQNRHSIDAAAVGIGSPSARLRVVSEVKALIPAAEWPPMIHPSAEFDVDTAMLSEGIFIGSGVVGTVNLTLHPFSLCNFGCTLGHEVTVGHGSVVNPGANVNGGVTILSQVLVGSGAQILQYLTIGEGATVGAGAVVTKNVPAGITVIGVPARPLSRN